MVTRDWIGTDPGNEGDWATAANWSGAAVPATGDTARLMTGTQSVTQGLDQSGVNLAQLLIGPDYSGNVASSANYLEIGATLVSMNGLGEAWLDCSTGSFNYDTIYVRGTGSGRRLYTKGNVTNAHIMFGRYTAVTGTIADLYAEAISSDTSEPDLEILDADVTNLWQMSGVTLLNGTGTITTLRCGGGTVTLQEGTCTNTEGWGGTIVANAPGTYASVKMFKGRFDGSKDDRAKTITNGAAHFGATIDIFNSADNWTLTNPLEQFGGRIIGRTVSTVGI